MGAQSWTYAELLARVEQWAQAFLAAGLPQGARVALFTDKQLDGVAATWGISLAGGVIVPLNPLLKPAQVVHVLRDCGAWGVVTQRSRWHGLQEQVVSQGLAPVVVVLDEAPQGDAPSTGAPLCAADFLRSATGLSWRPPSGTDADLAAIFYTSGSTGLPKGVMLSHRNLVAGANSVATYLRNHRDDVLLAVLPLSFDAGFSQLTTAFTVGAKAVLLNHFLPMDVLNAMRDHGVTGLTAVPPLYAQLAALNWPDGAAQRLRYWANTGGKMPQALLARLRQQMPQAAPFLMYGLTEAFRSSYLPPEQVDQRPGSMGRAIPNVELMVVRPDGTRCAPHEPGELVHRGPLVALGYWNRPEDDALRFRSIDVPVCPGGPARSERVVFSGDQVRADEEGYLYFVGRADEMIKTSGYRVSPTEVEEVAYGSGLVKEAVAWGAHDDALGQVIMLAVSPVAAMPKGEDADARTAALLKHFRQEVPPYMVPRAVTWVAGELPRTPNGKIDRRHWRQDAGI